MQRIAAVCVCLCTLAVLPRAAAEDMAGTPDLQVPRGTHPFIIWTQEEAQAIRKRIETQDWAQREYESLPTNKWEKTFTNLLRYAVMGDAKAGEREKKYLLSFIGARVDSRPWSDNYLTALRYDVFYDELTDKQRQRLEDTFRKHIQHELRDPKTYTRTSWLPNMQWCRKMGASLMAVAMQDEDLIRKCFECNGGVKYYLDDYLSDRRFYNEEFGKQYSMNGELLLWCRGLERLGLNEMGYGYVGKGGATVHNYIEAYLRLGYPRVDIGTDRHHYPMVTMGDAKGGGFDVYAFQKSIVPGIGTDDKQRVRRWTGSNMNGRDHKNRIVDKMGFPLWFEIAHRKWPQSGFDYFLVQMREPDQDRYHPSLYFGLDPIPADSVGPPPAPSGAYPERGISILRADESSSYWEGDKPAVSIHWATNYVHSVKDSFSLLGFYAFNRPIYVNTSCAPGYAGTDPTWSAGIHSHCGVMVDAQHPAFTGEIPLRFHSSPTVKFTAGRASDVYPNVTTTRALALTDEYLLDVYRLDSPTPRSYLWMVHAFGHACPENPDVWTDTRHLVGPSPDLREERSWVANDAAWAVHVNQLTLGAQPERSVLGERWWETNVGVRMQMLGEAGTVAYTARGPVVPAHQYRMRDGTAEPGTVVVLAQRTKPSTTFVALHEPFDGAASVREFRRIAQTPEGVFVGIQGDGYSDYVAVRYDDQADKPLTLQSETTGEAITFTGFAHVRIANSGKQVVAGKDVDIKIVRREPAAQRPAPVAVRWMPELLCIPTGGEKQAQVYVRNLSATARSVALRLEADPGLTLAQPEVRLADLGPGEEREVKVTVGGAIGEANRIGYVRAASAGDQTIQPAALKVAHGMCVEWSQFWPRQQVKTVYSPRYVMRYHFLDTSVAEYMRDPDGLRRSWWSRRRGREYFPHLRWYGKQDKKDTKSKWSDDDRPWRLLYWSPRLRDGDGDDAPKVLVESGTHPHQPHGVPLEYRWTEDWVIVWYRFADRAERVMLDWSSRESRPDKVLIHDGKDVREIEPGRKGRIQGVKGEVRAMFRAVNGYRYGEATLYPAGAKHEKDGFVSYAPDQPMAFTYCTEAEFPAFVKRWLDSDYSRARPRGQGDME